MVKRYEIVHSLILILFLVIAYLVGNSILKGILLLLFSAVLIYNTIIKLNIRGVERLGHKVFYGILLFLDILLAIGALVVIISAVL